MDQTRSKSSDLRDLGFMVATRPILGCSRPWFWLVKRSYCTVVEGNGSGLSGVVCGARMEDGGSRRGRHVDFVVYAGVWSRGLFECGSRDDGTRGAAAPAPVNPAPVTSETWRDLSSGRPRAARIVFAERVPPPRLIASRVGLAEPLPRRRGPLTH